MFLENKIKLKIIFEAFIALLIPVVYFFLIGGFNGRPQNEQSTNPYDPLSVIKTDFVKDIQTGKFDLKNIDTNNWSKKYESSKLKLFLSSQRVIFNTVKNPDTSSGEFYFRNVKGYEEKDSSGANVLYLSSGSFVDGREKMTKCYIAQDIYGNIPISLKHDTVGSSEWYIKPKMKIRKADFSPGDTRAVAAIIIYNFAGKMIDSTVIRVRNFSDLSGKYEGGYLEKYMTEYEKPGDNMLISSMELFKNMPKNNSGFHIKVFWFGEVDLRFEKITMDDNMANELLSGNYDQRINEETTPETFMSIAVMIRNNRFNTTNYLAINYVMNVMYNNLQNEAVPFSLLRFRETESKSRFAGKTTKY